MTCVSHRGECSPPGPADHDQLDRREPEHDRGAGQPDQRQPDREHRQHQTRYAPKKNAASTSPRVAGSASIAAVPTAARKPSPTPMPATIPPATNNHSTPASTATGITTRPVAVRAIST